MLGNHSKTPCLYGRDQAGITHYVTAHHGIFSRRDQPHFELHFEWLQELLQMHDNNDQFSNEFAREFDSVMTGHNQNQTKPGRCGVAGCPSEMDTQTTVSNCSRDIRGCMAIGR